jgi:predicted aspartyl protease
MIGEVDSRGTPVVRLSIAGREWTAVIDTGFDGFVLIPTVLASEFKSRLLGDAELVLSGGQVVRQKMFALDFPFDGETRPVRAIFAPVQELLVGTQLLSSHRLEINFVTRSVLLEKVAPT